MLGVNMADLEKNISLAHKMFAGDKVKMFSHVYTFTTETIADYINFFDYKDKKLLTLGSSGDQVLNAYYKGARDITLLDINPFAEYYLYLKVAAILTLNYEEFKEFFIKKNIFFKDKMLFCDKYFNRIKYILKSLNYESYMFFEEILKKYTPKQIKRYFLNDDLNDKYSITCYNNYLKSEEDYNKLKKIIGDIYIKYINQDILVGDIEGKYDNIFLSNLCTYIGLDKLKELVAKLDKNNLNNNGSILLAYLWNIDFYETINVEDWIEAYKMPVFKDKLKEYITEHHRARSVYNYIHRSPYGEDLVMIYRKK